MTDAPSPFSSPVPAPPAQADEATGSRFSLASLFVFMTLMALLLAAGAPLVRAALDEESDAAGGTWWWPVGGLCLGGLAGFALGLQQFRRGRAAAVGTLAGGLLGLVMGGLAMMDGKNVAAISLLLTIGSLVMVGVAFFLRPRE